MRPNYFKDRPPIGNYKQGEAARFARRPNRKVFWTKKSVGDFAFWEKKIFNHGIEN